MNFGTGNIQGNINEFEVTLLNNANQENILTNELNETFETNEKINQGQISSIMLNLTD